MICAEVANWFVLELTLMTELIWVLAIIVVLAFVYRYAIHPPLRKKQKTRKVEKELVENDEHKDLLIASFKAIRKELSRAGTGIDELKRNYNLMGTRTLFEVDQKKVSLYFEEDDISLRYANKKWYIRNEKQETVSLEIPFNHYDADYWHRAGDILTMLPLWCQAANTHYFLSEEEAKEKREQIETKLFREIDLFINDLSSRYSPSPLLNVGGS